MLFTSAEPALDATVRLGADLAVALGTAVDVVDLDRATIEPRGRVAERGRLLHSTEEPRRVCFEVDSRLRWIEFRPVVRETTTSFLRRVAEEGLRCHRLGRPPGSPGLSGGLDDPAAFAARIASLTRT